MFKITPNVKKIIRSSFFDEFEDPHKDFEIDHSRLMITEAEFEALTQKFKYFSDQILIEGILFKKRKKSDWFRNTYFILYEDRLVCYKDVEKLQMKGIIMLRGVKLEIFENLVELLSLNPTEDFEKFERNMFVFSRNKNFFTIYAGTTDIYQEWLSELKKCCIITNFNKIYSNIRIIGKGTFAKVMQSIRVSDQKEFAIKTFEKEVMLKSQTSNRSKLSLLNEINIMRRLCHQNIIKMYEIYEGEYHIYIVLELLKGGELFDRIVKKGNYCERDAIILITRLLQALEYIHSKGIMHRDIKPENLILKDENSFDLKLADFGLSEYQNKKENLFTRCGTPGYVAPEVLEDKKYDTKCDIFSAGVILYILLTGCSPFYGKNYNEILIKNRKCDVNYDFQNKMKIKVSEGAIDLIKWMLTMDPLKRPTAFEALSHYWILNRFADIQADNLLMDEGTEEDENLEYEVLTAVQSNMANYKKQLIIDVKDLRNDKDLSIAVNSPLITGKVTNYAVTDSPIMVSTPFMQNRKNFLRPDLSLEEKSLYLGKFGYIKTSKIQGIESGNQSSLLHAESSSFSLNSPEKLNNSELKSPSKFSISKKNNKVFKLNFPQEEPNNQVSPEEEKEVEGTHKRNYSSIAKSSFKRNLGENKEGNKANEIPKEL